MHKKHQTKVIDCPSTATYKILGITAVWNHTNWIYESSRLPNHSGNRRLICHISSVDVRGCTHLGGRSGSDHAVPPPGWAAPGGLGWTVCAGRAALAVLRWPGCAGRRAQLSGPPAGTAGRWRALEALSKCVDSGIGVCVWTVQGWYSAAVDLCGCVASVSGSDLARTRCGSRSDGNRVTAGPDGE